MTMKKKILTTLSVVLILGLAALGILAYLQSEDSDVNVMTLGNVQIKQHEYERVVENGAYKTDDAYGYLLKDFTQAKPLYPATEVDANGNPYNFGAGDYDSTRVIMSQVDSYGNMQVFTSKNAQDKFVTVENTGKSDAYVRTIVALELGNLAVADFDNIIGISTRSTEDDTNLNQPWLKNEVGVVEIDGNNYIVVEFVYHGAVLSDGSLRHAEGILPAGDTSYPNLCQVYMNAAATNEDCEAIDGNKNGTYDILVLSQAVQVEGFDDAATALDTAFPKGENNANVAGWFTPIKWPNYVYTLDELRAALAKGGKVSLGADITVKKSDLLYKADGGHSDGSAFFIKEDTLLDLNGHDITVNAGNAWADVFFMNFGADLTIKGDGDITADCSIACAYDADSTLNIEGGNFYVTANNDMLYSVYGKINVSGGTFTTSYWNTINIYGSGRVDRVDVSGGSFENWNPAASPDGNLLADGYKVVSEVVDGVTWYNVVPE